MLLQTIGLCLTTLLSFQVTHALEIAEGSQDFPLGSEVENLALRPSGRSVLANVYTFPHIYEVALTANSTPKLVYTFQNTTGVSSIAASPTTPDEYFVITGDFNFTTFKPAPESYAIHRLSFDKDDKPYSKKLASLDVISQPNGMISVPNTPYVLIADCRGGFVYRFDTETLELIIYFDNPLLKPNTTGEVVFGVNGIKLSRGYLYFSNTNQAIVARIKASGKESPLFGNPEIVATPPVVDDFIVNDYNGDIYIAENTDNALGFVAEGGNGTIPKTQTLIGGPNSTVLEGPTAAIWAKGAEGQTLIVSTAGNFDQFVTKNYTGGGRINVVHVG